MVNPFDDPRLATTEALVDAFAAVDAAIERCALDPLGLDRYTADLLTRLMQAPDRSLRGIDIARRLLISTSRTTRLLDAAQADGLVERRPDPDDRRAQQVTITDAGERLALEFGPLLLSVIDHVVVDNLSARERSTLIGLLRKLETAAVDATRDE